MLIFLGLTVLLIGICAFDYYELNDLRLLIPALEFKRSLIKYGIRTLYLTILFLELVIGMPIIEQRFYFIFVSNGIGEMKKLQDQFVVNIGRNSVINQVGTFIYHACTYVPIILTSFKENPLQLVTVSAVTLIVLIYIHILRARHGIVASITAQMIFNFSLYLLVVFIYYTDYLHKGYSAEMHTTLDKNSIDFIFGQNEDHEHNS